MCPIEWHHPWISVRLENARDMMRYGFEASHHQQNALSGQPMQEATKRVRYHDAIESTSKNHM